MCHLALHTPLLFGTRDADDQGSGFIFVERAFFMCEMISSNDAAAAAAAEDCKMPAAEEMDELFFPHNWDSIFLPSSQSRTFYQNQ